MNEGSKTSHVWTVESVRGRTVAGAGTIIRGPNGPMGTAKRGKRKELEEKGGEKT